MVNHIIRIVNAIIVVRWITLNVTYKNVRKRKTRARRQMIVQKIWKRVNLRRVELKLKNSREWCITIHATYNYLFHNLGDRGSKQDIYIMFDHLSYLDSLITIGATLNNYWCLVHIYVFLCHRSARRFTKFLLVQGWFVESLIALVEETG